MASGADGYSPLGVPPGFQVYPADGRRWARQAESGLQRDASAAANPPFNHWVRGDGAALGGLVPAWAMLWVESLLANWPVSVPLLALMVFVYLRNQSLALRIRDPGRKLWRKSVSGLHHSCPGG